VMVVVMVMVVVVVVVVVVMPVTFVREGRTIDDGDGGE
jgi:uncharacterized membrane protein